MGVRRVLMRKVGRVRIALSSYRSKPHSGGQGTYVRNLSRELVALGHEVTVFSGQPYPELDDGVTLVKLPSLDLYNDANPFRHPKPAEFRTAIDVAEYAGMLTGTFPELRTFALRLEREIARHPDEFDVLHDNQTLAPGIRRIAKTLPVVTTIHHPISSDRRLEIEAAKNLWQKYTKWRWYSFVPMQARIARKSQPIITVSEQSKLDIEHEFHVKPQNMTVVPVGVDVGTFTPTASDHAITGRITAITSAAVPLKGLAVLIDAVAELDPDRWRELVVVGKPNKAIKKRIRKHKLGDKVHFTSGLSDAELAQLIASADVHVVPSLYEGFSLPAVEAMACGTALVGTKVGALPALIHGQDDAHGAAGLLVEPGDPTAIADAIARLLGDPETRSTMARAGRARASETYSWAAVAAATVDVYKTAIKENPRAHG